jgi:hypothetical protein
MPHDVRFGSALPGSFIRTDAMSAAHQWNLLSVEDYLAGELNSLVSAGQSTALSAKSTKESIPSCRCRKSK